MANIVTSLIYYQNEEERKFWDAMTKTAISSLEGKLAGDWEYRQVVGDASTHNDRAFFKQFCQMYEWWKEGHNIYYTNVDIVAVKPVEIFGKYDRLWMWWPTEKPGRQGADFETYFNCGNLYIPKETKQEVWDLGFEEYKKYFSGKAKDWASDQMIYNKMLYAQGFPAEDYLDNTMHYLYYEGQWNTCGFDEAKLVHMLSTKNSDRALEKMKEVLGEKD